jgi:hypothetical protein
MASNSTKSNNPVNIILICGSPMVSVYSFKESTTSLTAFLSKGITND